MACVFYERNKTGRVVRLLQLADHIPWRRVLLPLDLATPYFAPTHALKLSITEEPTDHSDRFLNAAVCRRCHMVYVPDDEFMV